MYMLEEIKEGHDLIFNEVDFCIKGWPWNIYYANNDKFYNNGTLTRKGIINKFYKDAPFYKNHDSLFSLLFYLAKKYDFKFEINLDRKPPRPYWKISFYNYDNNIIEKFADPSYKKAIYNCIIIFLKNKRNNK